ncbi:hypothetical protein [Mesorhizobium sp. A623]
MDYEIDPIGNDTYRVTVSLSDAEMKEFRLAHIRSTGLNVASLPVLQVGYINDRIEHDESGIAHMAAVERRLFATYLERNPDLIEEISRMAANSDSWSPPAA